MATAAQGEGGSAVGGKGETTAAVNRGKWPTKQSETAPVQCLPLPHNLS